MKDRSKKIETDTGSESSVSRDELEKMFEDVLKPGSEDPSVSEEERLQRLKSEKLRDALYPKDR